MTTFFIVALAPFLLSQTVVGDFSYDGIHGPEHWGDDYKTCVGKFQSPIDIEEKDVTPATFPLLQFFNINNPHTMYMTNNGHTVAIQSISPGVPMISGGPTNEPYVFHQVHFHWGQTDDNGSEDLINNHPYSMELHAVFYKKSYGSSEEAMKHSDGLAVLAYFYEAGDEPNPTFDSIVSQMSEITEFGSNTTLSDSNVLNKMIAPHFVSAQNYYTYKGSLTTPPCLEIVLWIDFIEPLSISHEQLAAFRTIYNPEGKNVTHNIRPVQPIEGRVIYRNTVKGTTGSSGARNTPKATKTPGSTPSLMNSAKLPPTPKDGTQYSGQEGIWSTTPLVLILGTALFLQFQ